MTDRYLSRRDALKGFAAFAGASLLVACGDDDSGDAAGSSTLGTAASGASPSTTATASTAPTWSVEHVSVSASTTSVNHLWAQWGVKHGIYAKHFLDVEVIDNIQDPVAAMVAGQIDFMATGTGTVAGAVRGAPIRSQMLTYRDNYALMVDPAITTLDALPGKKIIGPNDVMKAAILRSGGDPESIEWITSRGSAAQNIELVTNGDADGVAGFPPLQFLAEDAGLRLALITSAVFPGAPVSNTATSVETMTQRPDYVKRMIAANLEILRHLRDNKPLVLEFFMSEWEQSADLAERSYAVIERDMIRSGQTDAKTLQDLVDIVAKAQGAAGPVAWTDVFDFTHLDDVVANPGKY